MFQRENEFVHVSMFKCVCVWYVYVCMRCPTAVATPRSSSTMPLKTISSITPELVSNKSFSNLYIYLINNLNKFEKIKNKIIFH